jgi:hypothetical protein
MVMQFGSRKGVYICICYMHTKYKKSVKKYITLQNCGNICLNEKIAYKNNVVEWRILTKNV